MHSSVMCWRSCMCCYSRASLLFFDISTTAGVRSWAFLYKIMLSNQNKFLRRSLKLFFSLKRQTLCHSLHMFYAKHRRRRAWALTETIDQTFLRYQYTAYYFLPLLSFLPMKENYKKDLQRRKRERENVSAGGEERECGAIVFIACGRWMMAQHKNPTKPSRWSLCDSKTPNVRWRFLPVTYESYLSKQRQELAGWYDNEAALLQWQIMLKR